MSRPQIYTAYQLRKAYYFHYITDNKIKPHYTESEICTYLGVSYTSYVRQLMKQERYRCKDTKYLKSLIDEFKDVYRLEDEPEINTENNNKLLAPYQIDIINNLVELKKSYNLLAQQKQEQVISMPCNEKCDKCLSEMARLQEEVKNLADIISSALGEPEPQNENYYNSNKEQYSNIYNNEATYF